MSDASPEADRGGELKPPPSLPDDGVLVGYSLEHERRTAPLGFQYADLPSVGLDDDEYLEPILHTGGGHIMTIAPTGAGKGVSCIVPTLLRFQGPVIVIDPKGENYAVTAKQRQAMGHEIALLDPLGVTGEKDAAALNPLDLVDANDPQAIDNAAMIASLLSAGLERIDPSNSYWYQRGEYLLAGVIQHVALSRSPEQRNLAEVARLINLPTQEFLQLVQTEMSASHDPTVQALAGVLLNPAEETVGSILSMSQNSLGFMRGELIERATSSSTFDLAAITDGAPISFYLVIPPDKLESHRNLLRLWIGVFMAALMRRRAPVEHPTLFILDEAAQLGSLDHLRQAITLMRGYGMQTWSFWQDLSQLKNLYPRDWETMYNNCRVHQSFGFTNLRAAREAGDLTGFMIPEDVLTLDADEMILSIAGDEAVIAQKPNYLTDPAFEGLYAPNPFYLRTDERAPSAQTPQRRYLRHSPALQVPRPAAVVEEPEPEPTASARSDRPFSFGTMPRFPAAENIPMAQGGHLKRQYPRGLAGLPGLEVLSPSELNELLGAVNDAENARHWVGHDTIAHGIDLSFYPGYRLYELVEADRASVREAIIRRGSEVHVLDGDKGVFSKLNQDAPIRITDASVLDYVRTFFRCVSGRHGRFDIIESIDDLRFEEPPDPERLGAFRDSVAPLALRETRDDGTRVIEARLQFQKTLSEGAVVVTEAGLITVENRVVLIPDIEAMVEADHD